MDAAASAEPPTPSRAKESERAQRRALATRSETETRRSRRVWPIAKVPVASWTASKRAARGSYRARCATFRRRRDARTSGSARFYVQIDPGESGPSCGPSPASRFAPGVKPNRSIPRGCACAPARCSNSRRKRASPRRVRAPAISRAASPLRAKRGRRRHDPDRSRRQVISL